VLGPCLESPSKALATPTTAAGVAVPATAAASATPRPAATAIPRPPATAIPRTAGVHTRTKGAAGRHRRRRAAHHQGWSRRARAAIVGGHQISIGQAPWQVEVEAHLEGGRGLRCGGSILDSKHILTAAHCVFNPENEGNSESEERIPVGDFEVIAGASELIAISATAQVSGVSRVRVHPYYRQRVGPAGGDDVAVLELSEKLVEEPGPTAAVKAISLVPAGATPPEGTAVTLTGFGVETETLGVPDGKLYSLGMVLGFSRTCGGALNALFLCASVSGGTACHGDSGSGLTTSGSIPTLVGVTDIIEISDESEYCPAGTTDGFVNIAAPEIRAFIEGGEQPPVAPRGGGAIIRGVPMVGQLLGCEPGSWSEHPTFTFAFIDSASGRLLQSGPASTYSLSDSDIGRSILCQVQATNAGGTGVGRTEALSPVQVAPGAGRASGQSPAPAPAAAAEGAGLRTIGASVPVKAGAALVKVGCHARVRCRGKLTLTARRVVGRRGRKVVRIVSIGTVSFSVAGNRATTVKVKLGPLGRALLRAAHGRLRARLLISQLEPAGAGPRASGVQLVQRGSGRRPT